MLAQNDEASHQAALSMYTLTGDAKICKQCEARERYELDKLAVYEQGLEHGIKQGIEQGVSIQKEKDNAIITNLESQIATLQAQLNQNKQN